MKLKLTIINIVFGLVLLLWPVLMMMSVFAFDAPGADKSPLTLSLVWSIRTYPVVYLIALIGSISLYRRNTPQAAIRFAALPTINIVWFFISMILIEVLCNGEFVCR